VYQNGKQKGRMKRTRLDLFLMKKKRRFGGLVDWIDGWLDGWMDG